MTSSDKPTTPGSESSQSITRRDLGLATSSEPVEFGEYLLTRQIGQGGFGEIYLAVHKATWREVAIKTLSERRRKDVAAVARFDLEAAAGKELSVGVQGDPGVVPQTQGDLAQNGLGQAPEALSREQDDESDTNACELCEIRSEKVADDIPERIDDDRRANELLDGGLFHKDLAGDVWIAGYK